MVPRPESGRHWPPDVPSATMLTPTGLPSRVIATCALQKLAPGNENDQRLDRSGSSCQGTNPAAGHAVPSGVGGRGPKSNEPSPVTHNVFTATNGNGP